MNRPMIVVEGPRNRSHIRPHVFAEGTQVTSGSSGRIGKDLEEMGYGGTRIILKCDQENPIAAVQQEVIKKQAWT